MRMHQSDASSTASCCATTCLQVLHKPRGGQQPRVAAGAAPVGGAAPALLPQQGQSLGQFSHTLIPLLCPHSCRGQKEG
jgi:hypothetical protein